jgi:predicted ATPase with chaperone activity
VSENFYQKGKIATNRLTVAEKFPHLAFKSQSIARTIADIENQDSILPNHLAGAIQFRSIGREG